MEKTKQEKTGPWLSVPQFGDWEQNGAFPNYSVDFSKIREMRKQNKREPSRASIGNEEELINPTAPANAKASKDHHIIQDHHSPTVYSVLFCLIHKMRQPSQNKQKDSNDSKYSSLVLST
ncbi:hypothetical protein V2J09_021681 [Rumex salicifolius]